MKTVTFGALLLALSGVSEAILLSKPTYSTGNKLLVRQGGYSIPTPLNTRVHDIKRTVDRDITLESYGGEAQPYYEGGDRISPPPDLPSLLLHNRIVYIGMPLVPAVTELIIAELLYLNYESKDKPVFMYINSPGTMNAQGQAVGFETEAFAIADVMNYIRPPIHTICIGQAFGAAAMLLSQGKKGKRFSLPNSSIMLHQPRSMARGQASDIAIKAKEVLANRKVTCGLIARACGKNIDTVMEDASRTKYLSPEEAVEYGIVDQVLSNKNPLPVQPAFMNAL